ncbi:MAG: DUF6328 family protein [Leucobacter sp.]
MAEEPEELPEREETRAERADRNWNELTQELRVTQTGVQILTAFLLILPFQQRFTDISDSEKTLYLTLVSLSIITSVLMVAPVSLHRVLFRQGRKVRLVQIADRIMTIALVFLALTLIGTVSFVFNVVVGGVTVWIATAAATLLIVGLWVTMPWYARVTEDPYRED